MYKKANVSVGFLVAKNLQIKKPYNRYGFLLLVNFS